MTTDRRHYGTAVAVTLVAFVLRLLLRPIVGASVPFLLFWPAIVASGLVGGAGPGILATLLAALLSVFYFLPPVMALQVVGRADQVAIMLFAVEGVLTALLTGALREARRRAEAELKERRQAEQTARRVEARTSAILSAALDSIITIDAEGRIVGFNPAAETVFGYPRAAAIGQELAELIIPPDLREQHQRGLAHYLAHGDGPIIGQRVEMRAMRADGSEFPVELTVSCLPGEGPPRFTGFIRDITARTKALEAARFHAHLLDTVEQAVIATDTTGQITYWNRFAERLYGWTAEEVAGRNLMETVLGPEADAAAEEIMERLRAGESWSGEYLVRRRDGTTFPALVADSAIYDRTGGIVGIVGVSVDISARKHAEEIGLFLAAASEQLAVSLDYRETLAKLAQLAIPYLADWCAVDMVEEDGSYRRLAIAHRDPEQVELAWEIERRYGFDPLLAEGAAKVLRTGESAVYPEISPELVAQITHDAEHVALIGRVGLTSGMIVPLIARGRTLGSISLGAAESGRSFGPDDLRLAEDLARRAALQIDNVRLYEEAQAAIRTRDEFLSIAAHEMKTPMTSLTGYAQVLQRRYARDKTPGDRDRRAVDVIAGQAERLSRLISALLDVSRIETGHFTLDRQLVDLPAVVRRVVEEVQLAVDQHTLELHAPEDRLLVEGDALRLDQVIQNLIQNAIKYSPDGGPIVVSVEQHGGQVAISVVDRGIGIPAEAQPRLFQRFYRAGSLAASNISGMGIGLYVVREIVSRHGGTVDVSSTEGQGSSFTIRLPLVQSGSRASADEREAHPVV